MRHCVGTYHHACSARTRAIWSLRHRWHGEHAGRSILTIDVQIASGKIVQIRGKANSRARGWPLELVRTWAAREGLAFHPRLADDGIQLAA
jgi:hypothetical protein